MQNVKKHWMLILSQVLLLLVLASAPAMAQSSGRPGTFGIGLGSGTNISGLSLKQHAGPTAIQGNIGCYGYYDCNGIGLSADLLYNMPTFFQHEVLNMAWNAGFGAGVGLHSDDINVAAAFVLGLEFNLNIVPVDLVVEWRPRLNIISDVDFDPIGFTGHVRFYLY